MSEIVKVPFHGTCIHTTLVKDEPHVVLRPTLEGMGLDFWGQLKKLRRRSWGVVSETETTGADGKTYVMATVNLDTWAMLLANIDEHRVTADARPLVVHYQTESARVLREYWTRGYVISPRVVEGDFFEPSTWTWDEAAATIRQRYGIAMTVNEITRALRTAGVLKQNGAPRKTYENWFWFTGSAWTVHKHTLPQITQEIVNVGRQLQEFRFIQARLELEGVGRPPLERTPARRR